MASTIPFASYSDLEAIWRPLTTAEQTVATARLTQASEFIRQAFRLAGRDADAEIDSGVLSEDLLTSIAVDMVHRVMLNPDKLRQFSKSIDDYQTSGTRDQSTSAGSIYLTDQEAALLGLTGSGRKSFTINPAYLD